MVTQAPVEFAIVLYSSQDILARLSERELISSSRPERARTHASGSSHTSSTQHTPTTRSRYARIRAVDAGVPTRSHSPALAAQPRVPVPHPGSAAPVNVAAERGRGTVPFVVILEPVYLGVLPATLLPTVGFLIPIVLAAVLFVPWVTAYLEPFAQQAREDLKKIGMTRTSKER